LAWALQEVCVKVFITGGSGFIGSNLVDVLLEAAHHVTVYDNMSTGREPFLKRARSTDGFSLVRGDLLDEDLLGRSMIGHDAVVHLAANADVRFGWNHPRVDFEQNTYATQNVLEAMRTNGIERILFSSTGSVYGETAIVPTPEDAPFPNQTSLYGASKFAAEGLIAAYAEAGVVSATIFRFVSILGPRYTHGHVIDFVAQLLKHPGHLDVLGDGSQRKSYLHVSDCVAAVVNRLVEHPQCETLNLGVDGYCEIHESARWIADRMELQPAVRFGGGDRGWVGDNPFIYLDTTKMRAAGWEPRVSIRDAVTDTVDWILQNRWVLDEAPLPTTTTD
jgi:UDP-glucose 4-epimerase